MSNSCIRIGFRSLVIATALSLSIPAPAQAEVREIDLKDLVAHSDLIVVATVTKIDVAPDDIKAVEDRYPPVKVATAGVVETWKGTAVKEVHFVASPTRYCDIAAAKEGENLVLFLERHGNGPMMIAHVGRGGMSIHDVKGKPYATVSGQVNLPEGTGTISETKKDSVTLPASLIEPGKKGTVTLDLTYELRSIELGTLRELVRKASADAPARTADRGRGRHGE
jgi:hypothetical protein